MYRAYQDRQTLAQRQAFARELRLLVARQQTRGRSLREVAEQGHITATLLRKWLAGAHDPNPRVLLEFCLGNRFPHIKLIRLLGWVQPKAAP